MSSEHLFESAPSHWRLTTLGELAKSSGGDIQTGPFGSQLHASDYVVDGIPSIMPKNISTDSVLTDDIARVSPEDIKRLAKYKVQVGDIVYSRRGDVEKCARITPREDGWLCGTGCLRVRVLPAEVSTEYLHAYLCHPSVREWIVRHAVGATMPNLNTSILSALPVYIPSEAEMNFIAATWLSISEKIQLNRQINQTLEQMAQAIFQSWFVDFEPVKAKIAAREDWLARQAVQRDAHDDAPQFSSPVCYAHEFADATAALSPAEQADLETFMNRAAMCAISGAVQGCTNVAGGRMPGATKNDADLDAMPVADYQRLYHTASLFPDELVESELGEIPKGWERVPFSAWVKIQKGKNITRATVVDGDVPVVAGGLSPAYWHNEYNVEGPAITISASGANAGYVNMYYQNIWSSDSSYINKESTKFFYVSYVCLKYYQKAIYDMQTGAAQPHIYPKDFDRLLHCFPEDEILVALELIFESYFEKLFSIERENNNLVQLRDTLLPKLLSGELDCSTLTD